MVLFKKGFIKLTLVATLCVIAQLTSTRLSADPGARVNWRTNSQQKLFIKMVGKDRLLKECLRGGLEMEYAYDFQLCRNRSAWFDSCGPERTERHRLRLDQISQQYYLTVDRHHDGEEPKEVILESKEKAIKGLTRIYELPLTFLADQDERLLTSDDRYLSLKVSSQCLGEYSRTFRRLSSILTLGIVNLSGFRTEWTDFFLDQRVKNSSGK